MTFAATRFFFDLNILAATPFFLDLNILAATPKKTFEFDIKNIYDSFYAHDLVTSAYFINLLWSNNMTENKPLHYYICNGHLWSNFSRAEAYANEYYEKTKIILGIERASLIFNKKTQRYEEA